MGKIYTAFLCVLLLVIGLFGGYFLATLHEKEVLADALSIIRPIRENDPAYKFVNPLLAYVIPSADQEADFVALKKKMTGFIDSQKQSGAIIDASVFLSDLNGGRWIGVNENQTYAPASMLKVVIMVAYYKEYEENKDILGKRLTYTKDLDQLLRQDAFNSLSALKVGQSYSVDELINTMIADSDNGAEFLLLNGIDESYLNEIYDVLDIENPENVSHFTISPRKYSLFFRILYSATYLPKNLSEKALEILSKTTFNDGIVAGVPENTVVSHKFGEYVASENGQIKNIELHDCGIVYYQTSPYLLCVMTRGADLEGLTSTIKNISLMVYAGMSH